MSDDLQPDQLLDELADARPTVPADLLEPNPQLIEEILMTTPKRRFVTPLRLGAAAAIAVAAAGLAVSLPTSSNSPTPQVQAAAPNMQRIAESTAAALTSGVAHVTYSSNNGHYIHDTGTVTVEFSGEDRSSIGTQDSGDPCADLSLPVDKREHCADQRGGFEFANKVVDGRFYLRDGAPGQQTWIEDTNEHITGSDIFSVDPRSLIDDSAQQAGFVDAGTATVDGVQTHHLKATELDKVPAVNLGLGPIVDDKTKVTKFEVWVDADNVVRRLDIATAMTQTVYPDARTVLTKDGNGKVVGKTLDTTGSRSEQRTQVNTYSVRFTDIGSDITIVAPANARKVAGQG